MPLVLCRECQTQLLDFDENCPECGRPRIQLTKNKSNNTKAIEFTLAAIIVFILLAPFIFNRYHKDFSAAKNTAESNQNPSSTKSQSHNDMAAEVAQRNERVKLVKKNLEEFEKRYRENADVQTLDYRYEKEREFVNYLMLCLGRIFQAF